MVTKSKALNNLILSSLYATANKGFYMETKYGIISTVYERKDFYEKILLEMMKEKVSTIILNGISDVQENLSYAIRTAAKTNIPIITIPREELYKEYYAALGKARIQYKNITDGVKNPYIKKDGHEIIILPGTTNIKKGRFIITPNKETGLYYYDKAEANKKKSHIDKILKKICEGQKEKIFKDMQLVQRIYSIHNLETLAEKIENPLTTTLISPNPRAFSNTYNTIDSEMLYEEKNGRVYTYEELMNEKIDPLMELDLEQEELMEILEEEQIKQLYVNNGDEYIKYFAEKNSITKTIASYPVPATHFAHMDESKYQRTAIPVPEEVLLTELHYNTGQAEDGCAGIITLKEDKAAYKNIVIQENIFGDSPFLN